MPVAVDADDAQQVILAFAQHFARVADARPRNLRGVQQPFDARLDLHEGAIIDDADDASFDKLADLVALFHRAPRVGQQLFPAEADALALAVHLENVDLDLLAHAYDLFGVVHALPGQLGDVDQAIGAAQVHEGAKIAPARDAALEHVALVQRLHELFAPPLLPEAIRLPVGEDQPPPPPVHFDHLDGDRLALRLGNALLALLLVHARINESQVRGGDKAAQTAERHQRAAPVVPCNLGLEDLAAVQQLLGADPILVEPRQAERNLQAFGVIDVDDVHGNLVVHGERRPLHGVQLFQVGNLDEAITLQPEIDDNALRPYRDDDRLPDVSDARLFIIVLTEEIFHLLQKISILAYLIFLIHF